MKRLLIVAVLVIALGVFGVAQAVSAQGTNPPTPVPGTGYGMGMMAGFDGMGPMHEYMQKELAGKLGITESELEALYAKGQTFWQIAEDKGFTAEQAQQMMVDARSAALDKMVADKVITKEQADWMKSRMGGMMSGGAGGCMGSGANTPRGGMMGGRGGRW
jgi:hypothetical protein